MKRAQAFKKSDYTEKPLPSSPGNLSQPFEAPFEKVVMGATQVCHKALGELRGDAEEVGRALSVFPYSSAARLAGATIFMFALWQLWKRFGSIRSKLDRFMR
jgi:hypothetical protein